MFFILMEYSIHIDTRPTTTMKKLCISRCCLSELLQNDVFMLLQIICILAKSADPDEMLP